LLIVDKPPAALQMYPAVMRTLETPPLKSRAEIVVSYGITRSMGPRAMNWNSGAFSPNDDDANRSRGGSCVEAEGSGGARSTHKTQAEADTSARDLARKNSSRPAATTPGAA
jgi:hypothetical protein